jgi:hypothetical protein
LKVKYAIGTGMHHPIKKKLRRTGLYEEKVIGKEVEGMMNERIIRKSKSEWTTLIIFIEKPNKGVRFCINYWKLKKLLRKTFILFLELMIL